MRADRKASSSGTDGSWEGPWLLLWERRKVIGGLWAEEWQDLTSVVRRPLCIENNRRRVRSRELREEETVAIIQGELMALGTTMVVVEVMRCGQVLDVAWRKLAEFASRLDVRCERKREDKMLQGFRPEPLEDLSGQFTDLCLYIYMYIHTYIYIYNVCNIFMIFLRVQLKQSEINCVREANWFTQGYLASKKQAWLWVSLSVTTEPVLFALEHIAPAHISSFGSAKVLYGVLDFKNSQILHHQRYFIDLIRSAVFWCYQL